MLWSTIAPVLLAQLTACALETSVAAAATPAFTGRWKDQQRPLVHPQIQAELLVQITSVRKLSARDDWSDDTSADFVRTYQGQREATINVQVRSWNQNVAGWALEFCERIVTRFCNRISVHDALYAVNCGIIESLPVTNVGDVMIDNRLTSVASADIRLRAAFVDVAGAESLEWFDKIDLSTFFKHGTITFPVPPNLLHQTVPEP